MEYADLIYETASGIATITLNRPKVMNALSLALLRELLQAATRAEGNPAIRVLIVTGAGEKAFAAGADIPAFRDMGAAEALSFLKEVQAVMNGIEQLKKPVLAAVNGYA
ncbi:MAG: enoyl-CoA hydratase/isomerase family protein, partial [Candidatus Methylomirabilales bacterium]